ncbi:preprotein translocase subunit SecY [marine bacterium AO1-C]|nr:preprotein translocase subunit SecY [marine bacterium AO1-C]
MKKFITTLKNIYAIKELRTRLINTFWLLVVFRLGSFIVLPGVDSNQLPGVGDNKFLGLLDVFLGGAFSKASIFALGIMPYISASIVIQLMEVAVPYFQKLKKEGESGFKKKTQITRYLTIVITAAQAIGYIQATIPGNAIMVNQFFFTISTVIILTAGTIFTMWLGEKIDDRGIGQGISLLIMIGIISRLPEMLIQEGYSRVDGNQLLILILEMVVLFFVVMSVVMLTEATRRIPIQYAKQVVGNRVYGGQRQYLPLKVNAAGVMPIIFAQALMFVPALVAPYVGGGAGVSAFSDFTTWQYNLVFGLLIIIFTYFYTAISVNPKQIADDLKRNGGFIAGVKPGSNTSDYIDKIMSKITLPGSIWLAIVAILPAIAVKFGVQQGFAQFYGGTSLLIMVGVILNTLQQINSYLLMRRYDGYMKSGDVKGRSQNIAVVQ